MSGGHWGYQQYAIEDLADKMQALLKTAAATEHILDWAICADRGMEESKEELWKLWERFFDRNSFRS